MESVAVPGISKGRCPGVLDGRSAWHHKGYLRMVLHRLLHGIHDEAVHVHLLLSVHWKLTVVRVPGVSPGLVEDERGGAETLHVFDKFRKVRIVRGVKAGNAAGLLEADVSPFLFPECLGNPDAVLFRGLPARNLPVAVFRGIGLYVVAMPLEGAAANVQIAYDGWYSGRVQELPEVVFDSVLGEGIAYGQDLQRVRRMEVADVLDGLVGMRIEADGEGGRKKDQRESFHGTICLERPVVGAEWRYGQAVGRL